MRILNKMEPVLLQSCFDLFGIHPVQAFLISTITTEEESIFRKVLKGKLMQLSIIMQLFTVKIVLMWHRN